MRAYKISICKQTLGWGKVDTVVYNLISTIEKTIFVD